VSHTREVVALAARAVHLSVRGQVAEALPTVAVTSPAAGALPCQALAGAGAKAALVALTAWPHVARAADAHPALKRAFPLVALWAVHLGLRLAVAAALGMKFDFQRVAEPHWFYHNMPSVFFTRGETYGHIERHLEEKMVAAQSCSRRSSAGDSGSTCRGQNKGVIDTACFFVTC